jgi:hypothetical protein
MADINYTEKCLDCGKIVFDPALLEQHKAVIKEQAKAEAEKKFNLDRQIWDDELTAERTGREQAENTAREYAKKAKDVEDRERNIDVEVAQRTQAEKDTWESNTIKEKDKQIQQLTESLDEAKRIALRGPPQAQGEVLEEAIKAELKMRFPFDEIEPKSHSGADIKLKVRGCGKIAIEAKNTKDWQKGWIPKAKENQRNAGADVAVIVSKTLPAEISDLGLGRIDDVYVADKKRYLMIITMLRDKLIGIKNMQAAADGKAENKEQLYDLMIGSKFWNEFKGEIDVYHARQELRRRSRATLEKTWAEEDRLDRQDLIHLSTMWGDIAGIVGPQVLPPISLLEFDPPTGPVPLEIDFFAAAKSVSKSSE